MKKFYASFSILCIGICMGNLNATANIDTLPAGSYIINMGIVPQTIGNGLRPYGLVYSLVKAHRVPVRWVVNPSKGKDGIDFIHNNIQYRGGTFIIPFQYRTPQVNAVIRDFENQGVIGKTSVSELVLNVTKTIYYAPNWTMDKQNGMIVASYFANAGIPMAAFGGDSSTWKNPNQLNACDDIFVLPHADPTWANHQNLFYWNKNHKGNLWVACHAVSELENMKDPVTGVQLNFLSTRGLVDWSLHKKDASPPYQYSDHGNPIMQFMRTLDQATNIGSEKTFLPKIGSSWRPTTTLGVYDVTNPFIPLLSAGPAAIVAYGRAYGDSSRGYVMYEAGHDHNSNGSESERVAAQRAFFNFSFYVAVDRYAAFETQLEGLPETIIGNENYNLSFNVPPGIDLDLYTVQWSSSNGGSFTRGATKNQVTFRASEHIGATIVTVTITDGCGHEIFSSGGTYVAGILPVATTLQGKYDATGGDVQLKWTERNNQAVSHYEIQRTNNNNEFKTIAILFTQENGDKVIYAYRDRNLTDGFIKYRLKINSSSKGVTYSNIVKITIGNATSLKVSVIGNPTRGNVSFEYQSPITGTITATILDMNGKMIASKKLVMPKGTSIVQMGDFSAQPAGTYLLRVLADGQAIVSRFNLVR